MLETVEPHSMWYVELSSIGFCSWYDSREGAYEMAAWLFNTFEDKPHIALDRYSVIGGFA